MAGSFRELFRRRELLLRRKDRLAAEYAQSETPALAEELRAVNEEIDHVELDLNEGTSQEAASVTGRPLSPREMKRLWHQVRHIIEVRFDPNATGEQLAELDEYYLRIGQYTPADVVNALVEIGARSLLSMPPRHVQQDHHRPHAR